MSDTDQKLATASMSAGGGNKNTLNREVGVDGKRDWSFGLFDCFSECGLCCWATWCPCVVYGKNKERLRNLQDQGVPLPGGGERHTDDCCVYGALNFPGYGWVLQISTRADIRNRYGIRGDGNGDCFASGCCTPCALTQERREIELEEKSFY
ncbi:PLAC8-domain-containing protein [Multifurca ochricompacta]|uniref:PLAC8-domain-containing protein n=1 Tax=Multifurca ochricompacta TaxID=376703 RepID=A0AAD4MA79_9AGAM|nr:PLAC8-domain-containing protein [Multifurca ochricompacta]